MRPDNFTDSTVIVTPGQLPPPDYDDGCDRPLEKIPLSELMRDNDAVCPLCGNKLPIDTREQVMDGSIWHVCKKCPERKSV